MLSIRTLVMASAIGGVTVICPLCEIAVSRAAAQNVAAGSQVADTASVRLHISGMTCGTCPATARLALRKLPGVYSATVTLDDSAGVVKYDPRRVAPEQITAHLARLTGFKAAVLPAFVKPARKPGTR